MSSPAQHLTASTFVATVNTAVMNILVPKLISGPVIIFSGHIPGSDTAGSKETHIF